MEALIPILIIALAVVGAPLFVVFGAAAMLLFGALPDTPITGAGEDVFSEKFLNPTIVTIPLFTFAGYIMAESGTPRRLVELSRAWLGWLPGGLAIVCVMASGFFTSFTGGSGVTIVAIGGLLYPALIQEKYGQKFSLGLVTSAGALGLLFPPSVPLLIYGIVGEVRIEKLYLAGAIPGFLTLLLFAAYCSWFGVAQKMPRTPFVLRNALAALNEAKWEVGLPIVLIGGLATGLMRIHEASAFAAIYTLIIEVFVYKDISIQRDLPRIIRESVTLVGAILVILATAIGFTGYLIQAEVPQKLLASMETFITTPWMFLLALNAFLIVVGMLMDIFSAIVVVVPLIVPIAKHFGIDPYHLGIVFLLNLEIGYLTPPVGLNLFISSFRFEQPVVVLYRAVLPFIGLFIGSLVITTYVPSLSIGVANLVFPEEDRPVLDDEPIPDDVPVDEPMPDEGEPNLDDLEGGGETLDDLEGGGETLDDLEGGGETLDDLEGETLDDLEGQGAEPTLDDLEREEQQNAPAKQPANSPTKQPLGHETIIRSERGI